MATPPEPADNPEDLIEVAPEEPVAVVADEGGEKKENEWESLLGGTGVMKKLLVKGDGDKPEYGQMVTIRYEVRNQSTGEVYEATKEETVIVGDREVVAGLELAAKMMSVGEKCLVRTEGRFGYGSKQVGTIPPDTNLEFELEMVSFGGPKKAPVDMTIDERVEAGMRKKALGNRAYKQDRMPEALQFYKAGLQVVEGEKAEDKIAGELTETLRKTRVDCANNIVQVYLKMGKDKEAKEAVIKVLTFDPFNVKGLTRAASMSLKENEFQEAEAVLKRALSIEPNNETLQKQHRNLLARKKAYAAKQRKMYGGKLKAKSPTAKASSNTKTASTSTPDAPPSAACAPQEIAADPDTPAASSSSPYRYLLFGSLFVGLAAAAVHLTRFRNDP